MTKILKGTTALFLLISGAFYRYDYNKTALAFLCLAIALSLITLFSMWTDTKKSKARQNEINLQEFTFVDPPGYYTHPKYPYPLCPSCLIKNNLKSPVSKGYCTVCKEPISETLVSGGDVFTVRDKYD